LLLLQKAEKVVGVKELEEELHGCVTHEEEIKKEMEKW